VRTRIKDFLKAHKGEGYGTREKWIRGVGWDQAHFGGVMPTAVCLLLFGPEGLLNFRRTNTN
jgi:predicted amidohydrolase YtcJ